LLAHLLWYVFVLDVDRSRIYLGVNLITSHCALMNSDLSPAESPKKYVDVGLANTQALERAGSQRSQLDEVP
jgi:hypothetical protein